jgi:hypothetical protein
LQVGGSGREYCAAMSRRSDAYETLTIPLQFAYIPREVRRRPAANLPSRLSRAEGDGYLTMAVSPSDL